MDARCVTLARTFHAPPPSLHRLILARFVIRFCDRDARAERAFDGLARALAFEPTFHAPRDRRPSNRCSAHLTWCTRWLDALLDSERALGFRARARSAHDGREMRRLPSDTEGGSAGNGKERAPKQRVGTVR